MRTPWKEPFTRFADVFARASAAQPKDPNAMSLATVDAAGMPSVRVVLMKDFSEAGFVFYTNGTSRKGTELGAQKVAALMWYWPALDEQVRAEGTITQVAPSEADAYFATRARASQLGAWASNQSQPLSSREELEARLVEVTARYQGGDVPRPPHWGGYRLKPARLEFWKAHPHRLHWRESYAAQGDGWDKTLLNP